MAVEVQVAIKSVGVAVRSDGLLGEWVATLHDPAAGVDSTLMYPTPETLRAALVQEAERAERKRAWVR
ncbi:hypothetical protein ETD83_27035 [Actinomadura soli]|uniref:Uncharacterized protein n=1 Tax=Actinomadura soli TaxID=2508997 RepID=A0A5C4J6L7_9ACTN|nr:hypothetical protein [Actinomadura soli]TMQ92546.1 hypothetical protein ETD83_27035 [Actinomadura soli]